MIAHSLTQISHLIEEMRHENPDVIHLARVISLSVQAEPELLRKARLTLLPGVHAGVEADLWFSPLVESENALALVLLPEVAELLRQELSQDQALLDRAWKVVRSVHKNAPPAIKLEERVIWLALSKKLNEIEQQLQSVIFAMVTEERLGLAWWTTRALPRFPHVVHQANAFWLLAIGASARLGGRQIVAPEELPNMILLEQLRWLLPENIPRIPVGVRLLENSIQFCEPSTVGAHVIELPKFSPLLVEVSWQEEGIKYIQQVNWLLGQIRVVQLRSDEITLRTAFGETYILRPKSGIKENTSKRYVQETTIVRLQDALSKILSQGSRHIGYCWKYDKDLNGLEHWLSERGEGESDTATVILEPIESIESKDVWELNIDL